MKEDLLYAALLGGALGDSIGLPSEGMNARRIAKLSRGPLRQRLIFGKGMVSDDTEHAVMTMLSLSEADHDSQRFAKRLAGRLRWWFAAIPAGIGLATARSILKLWIGVNPARSGVWSAGNGPLMRAPIIGIHFADSSENRERFVTASTLITHRDPRALESAKIIALAAALATTGATNASEILDLLETHIESDEMKLRYPLLRQSLDDQEAVQTFADRFNRKAGYVTGFAPDSASVAIYSWLRHRGDFRTTIEQTVRAGGDTDTIAFIAGSLAAIDCGADQLPKDWVTNLRDWPINPRFLKKISTGKATVYPFWPATIFRNAFFLAVVLIHGFRRLLPPF